MADEGAVLVTVVQQHRLHALEEESLDLFHLLYQVFLQLLADAHPAHLPQDHIAFLEQRRQGSEVHEGGPAEAVAEEIVLRVGAGARDEDGVDVLVLSDGDVPDCVGEFEEGEDVLLHFCCPALRQGLLLLAQTMIHYYAFIQPTPTPQHQPNNNSAPSLFFRPFDWLLHYKSTMQKVDYYECLGLAKTASHEEVKQAYRKLALVLLLALRSTTPTRTRTRRRPSSSSRRSPRPTPVRSL